MKIKELLRTKPFFRNGNESKIGEQHGFRNNETISEFFFVNSKRKEILFKHSQ